MLNAPKSFPDAKYNPANGAWEIAWSVGEKGSEVRWVDVRESHEFEALPKLPFAESIPLSSVLSSLQSGDRDQGIVVVCRSGGRSARAAVMLNQIGFVNVVSLQGGMQNVKNAMRQR